MDRSFVNVVLLGFGFMFLFTAFQTMGNIEVILVISNIQTLGYFSYKFIDFFMLYFTNSNILYIPKKIDFSK